MSDAVQPSVLPATVETVDLQAGSSPARAIRRCAGVTKAGQPCQSSIVLADGFCSYHSPNGIDPQELGRRGGLASGEARREQAKSVRDRLREKVEAEFDRIWSAFEAGLLSDDERVRVLTAVQALDQAYGKPAIELRGDPDAPVAFVLDSLLARAQEADQ